MVGYKGPDIPKTNSLGDNQITPKRKYTELRKEDYDSFKKETKIKNC